jgi:hypothetical protein
MASASPSRATSDLVDVALPVAAGVGVLILALARLAIPIVTLTAVTLIPLLISLLLISLAGRLTAAPFRLLRRLFRRAAVPVPVKGETT